MYRRNYPDDPGAHNMGDSHTRVTYRRNAGFLERIGNSLCGMLVGVILLFVASGLLFWNEGRAVKTAKSLDEGLSTVLPLQNSYMIQNTNNGRLVHLTGKLQTNDVLTDSIYGISVHAVKLKRTVEMYQWVEHETKREYDEGGETRVETTYSYDLEWRTELISSSGFDNPVGHKNPLSFHLESQTFTASTTHVGIFVLGDGLVSQISEYHPIPEHVLPRQNSEVAIYNGKYYSGSPTQPQPGDIRVSYQYAGISGQSSLGEPDEVSIIARQLDNRLISYQSEYGHDIQFLYFGRLSAEQIFSREQQKNTFMTWGIRFGGWLLMFVAFGCLTSILTTLVDWLPIVRNIVALGVTIMNLTFSISLSLTVIAIGWITYRPFLGITILAMAIAPFVWNSRQRGGSSYSH